ncbi:hypothetical protein WPS_30270 [Vulcanimicrobium alpinum]|uniref:Uncharacterized protein n=1 Tax=Vulcanimicrobium alpinum TaxID=3016050 RepID=A0AAN2CB21_UNVUL|nr:hypothetical protein [Vulcanimicrobium alpinum]BDE07751.1 hypothetical protein WPS_30270 [Vulcanimicrobium alpinum]
MVGILRDQDGAVVTGARVTALDAAGRALAADHSAADGTFALAAPQRPAMLTVSADDADPLRVAVPLDGAVTAIVRRHRAADAVPSAADVAALPAGSLAEIGTSIPYWIAVRGALGDRWLARGRGVTTIESLPFYRRGDGTDASTLLPSHAIGAVTTVDPLRAPSYGDRAGGGAIDARLFDRVDALRATNRDAVLAAGNAARALIAQSWDPDGERRFAAGEATGRVGPIAATLVALAGDLPHAAYAGAGTVLRGATRTFDVTGALALTRDAATDGIVDGGSVASAVFDVAARGPNALSTRLRWRSESGIAGTAASTHRDAAIVVGASRGSDGGLRVNADLALAYGSDRTEDGPTRTALALLPSLELEALLGGGWTARAGAGASTLGTPGVALARASLAQAGFQYSDRRRLRFEALAYAESTDAPSALTRGFAAGAGWEIAPRLSLRAWTLNDADREQRLVQAVEDGPYGAVLVRRPFRRGLAWLTWDAPVRIDLLVRAGALEGDARIPLGAHAALVVGSARRVEGAQRQLSIGLTAR